MVNPRQSSAVLLALPALFGAEATTNQAQTMAFVVQPIHWQRQERCHPQWQLSPPSTATTTTTTTTTASITARQSSVLLADRSNQQQNDRSSSRDIVNNQGKGADKGNEGYQFGDLFLNKVGQHVTGKIDYKFGDVTKAVGRTMTGKNEYEFGDISRWLDSKAKGAVNDITGKDDYKFGDLTRYLDEQAKLSATNFTKKDEYIVGDISKEVVRRATNGEYETEDMLLLLRVLAAFGTHFFAPVAAVAPLQFLLKMYTCGVEMDVANRVLEMLAQSVNTRIKDATVENKNHMVGNMARNVVLEYVGQKAMDGARVEVSTALRSAVWRFHLRS